MVISVFNWRFSSRRFWCSVMSLLQTIWRQQVYVPPSPYHTCHHWERCLSEYLVHSAMLFVPRVYCFWLRWSLSLVFGWHKSGTWYSHFITHWDKLSDVILYLLLRIRYLSGFRIAQLDLVVSIHFVSIILSYERREMLYFHIIIFRQT